MAQILAFPGRTQIGKPLSAEVLSSKVPSAETGSASSQPSSSQIVSAAADFERMMAHHSELQARMAEFNRLCEQALAERPMADLLYHPTACGGEVCRA